MAERPHETLVRSLEKELDKTINKNPFTKDHHSKTSDHLSSLFQTINSLKNKNKDELYNSVQTSNNVWSGLIDSGIRNYNHLYENYCELNNQENIIKRIETDASWRTFKFRVGTTATIAFILGLVYSIAGNCDYIYLPLQNKTVIHYYDGKSHPTPPPKEQYNKIKTDVNVSNTSKPKYLGISPM